MRIPTPTQIISVVTAFCGFHISPRHFSGATGQQPRDRVFVVLVSSDRILPAVRRLSYLWDGPCGPRFLLLSPEVRQFVPRDILSSMSVTWPRWLCDTRMHVHQIIIRHPPLSNWDHRRRIQQLSNGVSLQICNHGLQEMHLVFSCCHPTKISEVFLFSIALWRRNSSPSTYSFSCLVFVKLTEELVWFIPTLTSRVSVLVWMKTPLVIIFIVINPVGQVKSIHWLTRFKWWTPWLGLYQGLLNGASIINLRVGLRRRWPDGISSLEEKLSSDTVKVWEELNCVQCTLYTLLLLCTSVQCGLELHA